MGSLIDYVQGLTTPVSWEEGVTAIGFSFIASVVVYLLYQTFYGSRHIGAGVHRTFILGGPAITALFLGIQTSIPLSLGLLGALSFVRFRTPVKDPAEIGFLLLLIASSIGAATNNYLVTGILFLLIVVALTVQHLAGNRFSFFGRGPLMISLNQSAYQELEPKLAAFLKDKVSGLKLESMSVIEDRVSLQYQYRRKSGFDRAAFASQLTQIVGKDNVEVFIG